MASFKPTGDAKLRNVEWVEGITDKMLFFTDKQTISIPECKDKGLHFLFWGIYGSPDAEDYIISSDDRIIKKYNINNNSTDGYEVIGKNEFCILDLPEPIHIDSPSKKWYVNTYSNAGTCLYVSFFETTPTLYLETTLNQDPDDEAMVLFKHRFYPKYEVYDFPKDPEITKKLYEKIDIAIVKDLLHGWTVTIPQSKNNFDKMDVFIVLHDLHSGDSSVEKNMKFSIDGTEYNTNKNIIDECLSLQMLFDLKNKSHKIVFGSADRYSIKSIKVIYHN